MIAGIGTDLVQIDRIAAALARTPRLAQRILRPQELAGFEASQDQARYLAKRFAAKEAAVKALDIAAVGLVAEPVRSAAGGGGGR
jgi:holo-[acyl-carrier protein] synthase